MREAAVTVREAGLEPWSARRHRRAPGLDGRSRRRGPVRRATPHGASPRSPDWRVEADRILDHLQPRAAKRRSDENDRRFEKTPGWLDWCPRPSTPRFMPPPGAVDAHCHVFGPGAEFPFAPERKYTPCDASKAQLFALRDHLGFARNVDRAGHLPRRRQPRDGRRVPRQRRQGARRGHRPPRRHRSRAAATARRRRARRALQLPQAPRRLHAPGRAGGDRRRIEPLGWHVVVYFEARDLPELWDFFTALPTDGRRRSHGPARRHASRSTARSSGCSCDLMRRHENIWTKVSCPERLSRQRAARARRRAQRRTATSCRSRAAWSRPSPTACSGAPTGRTRT